MFCLERRTYLINTAEDDDLMTEDEDDDFPPFKSNKRSHHSCLSCRNSPILKRRPMSDFRDRPTMAAEGQATSTKQPEVTTMETQETIEPTKTTQKQTTTKTYYDQSYGHEIPEYTLLGRHHSLEDAAGDITNVESFPAENIEFDVKEPEELSEPSCSKCLEPRCSMSSESIYTFPHDEEQTPIDFSLTCRCDQIVARQRTQQQVKINS